MSLVTRYTCRYEEIFGVEASLAAAGYTPYIPWYRNVDAGQATVLKQGMMQILLAYTHEERPAEIEIAGDPSLLFSQVLSQLPFHLSKQPPVAQAEGAGV